jgi:hypothetical protein
LSVKIALAACRFKEAFDDEVLLKRDECSGLPIESCDDSGLALDGFQNVYIQGPIPELLRHQKVLPLRDLPELFPVLPVVFPKQPFRPEPDPLMDPELDHRL